jgi:hypothetical protein
VTADAWSALDSQWLFALELPMGCRIDLAVDDRAAGLARRRFAHEPEILPGVDDGAESLEESLDMVRALMDRLLATMLSRV